MNEYRSIKVYIKLTIKDESKARGMRWPTAGGLGVHAIIVLLAANKDGTKETCIFQMKRNGKLPLDKGLNG